VTKPRSITSDEPGISVSAPATRPPVQDSAVAMVSLRIRHRSSSERERARASLPLISVAPTLIAPGQADGGARGGGDAFSPARETKPFAGGGFHRDAGDVEPGDLGDTFTHGIAQRPDFRSFANHRHLEIRDPSPRAVTRSTAYFRKRSDAAPFHLGSLGGKCEPISPSASAPRMASTSACRPTSPSEWARKPRLCGTRTPQSIR